MAYSKVILNGTTLIDLTQDTIESNKILSGYTGKKNDGTSITGNIATGIITNNTSGGTSTATINRGNQIKIGAGYYSNDVYYTAQSNSGTKAITEAGIISVDGYADVNVAAGIITNNTSGGTSTGTINRGQLIKIGAGFYKNDIYYQALDNTGILTLDSSTYAYSNILCSGYKNVYITGLTLPTGSSMTVNVMNLSGSTLDTTNTLTVNNNNNRRTILNNYSGGSAILYNQGACGIYSLNKTSGSVGIYAYINDSSSSTTYGAVVADGKWISPTITDSGTYYGRIVIPPATPTFSTPNVNITSEILGDLLIYNNQAEYNEDGKRIEGVPIGRSHSGTIANITYNSTISGWVKKNSGDIAIESITIPTYTGWSKLKEVILLPAITVDHVQSIKVTVPNGEDDTITLTIEVDSDGNSNVFDDAPSFANGVSF